MDHTLKQRLVGAAVIVALAVIFIPIILQGPSDEWTPRSHDIPVPPAIEYRSGMDAPVAAGDPFDEPVPLDQEAPADGEQALSLPPATETVAEEQPEPAPVTRPAEPKPAPAPEPVKPVAVDKTASPATTVTAASGGWFVQVGSFSKKSNADGLRKKLDNAGFDAVVETGSGSGKSVYRVLVGPEGSREAAAKLAGVLQKQQQLEGLVVDRSR